MFSYLLYFYFWDTQNEQKTSKSIQTVGFINPKESDNGEGDWIGGDDLNGRMWNKSCTVETSISTTTYIPYISC